MAIGAMEVLQVEALKVLADGGYSNAQAVAQCERDNVEVAVQIGVEIWVIDAFQKKPKTGIKTPQVDVDRIRQRVKRLREALR